MISLIGDMFNNRINEIIQKANPPFVYAYGYYGDFMSLLLKMLGIFCHAKG